MCDVCFALCVGMGIMGVVFFICVMSGCICLLCNVLPVMDEGRSPSGRPKACPGPFRPTAFPGGRKNVITQSILVRLGCPLDTRQL